MDVSMINGQAPVQEYIPLDEDWISMEFTSLKEATDWALPRGWAAKPQRLQVRGVDGRFIVERFDATGCGCGG